MAIGQERERGMGKGRRVMLPESLAAPLKEQLAHTHVLNRGGRGVMSPVARMAAGGLTD